MGNRALMQDDEPVSLDSERDPFSENVEEIAFFPGGHRRQYLESLLHLTRFGRPLMLVSGPDGIGKTLLKEQFLAFIDEAAFAVVEVDPSLETEVDFYAELCHQLGIRTAGMSRDQLDNVLLQFAEDLGLQAKTMVIVIDDAHELANGALKGLFRLCREAENRSCQLHFLLFGAQTLMDLVEESGYEAEFAAFGQQLLMDPLSEEETREYIHYRLESSGIPSVEFSRSQMQTIYVNSGGVPSEINRYARALMNQVGAVRPKKFGSTLQWVAGGAVAALFLVGLFVAKQGINNASESANVSNSALGGRVQDSSLSGTSVALPPPLEIKPVIDATSSATAALPMSSESSSQPSSVRDSVEKPIAPPAPVTSPSTATANYVPPPAPVLASPERAVVHTAPVKAALAEKVVRASAPTHPAVAQKVVNKVEKPVAKPVAAKPVPVKPEPTAAVSTDAAKVAAAAKTVAKVDAGLVKAPLAVTNEKTDQKAVLKDPQRLLTRSPQRFTLQLLGAKDEAKVKSFISLHKTAGDFAYFKTRNQSGDWYVVVTGDYASRDQAKAAIAQLPQELQLNKPWPRSMQTVHEDIQKAK